MPQERNFSEFRLGICEIPRQTPVQFQPRVVGKFLGLEELLCHLPGLKKRFVELELLNKVYSIHLLPG